MQQISAFLVFLLQKQPLKWRPMFDSPKNGRSLFVLIAIRLAGAVVVKDHTSNKLCKTLWYEIKKYTKRSTLI